MKKETLNIVIIIMLCLILLRTCTLSTSKIDKKVARIEQKIDSLASKKDIQLEGLKNEKRFIQATDRKMLDVQRQSEIDKEIEKLTNKN